MNKTLKMSLNAKRFEGKKLLVEHFKEKDFREANVKESFRKNFFQKRRL